MPTLAWPSLLTGLGHVLGGSMKTAVGFASTHTGLPAVVVASTALVVSWRMFRRALRLAVEMTIAMTVVLVATKLGWINF